MSTIFPAWLIFTLSIVAAILGGFAGWYLHRQKSKRHANKVAKYKKSRLSAMRLELDNADTRYRKLQKEQTELKNAFSDLEAKYREAVMESEKWRSESQKMTK